MDYKMFSPMKTATDYGGWGGSQRDVLSPIDAKIKIALNSPSKFKVDLLATKSQTPFLYKARNHNISSVSTLVGMTVSKAHHPATANHTPIILLKTP